MKRIKISFLIFLISMSIYNCSDDDNVDDLQDPTPIAEEPIEPEDPAVTLANDRMAAVALITNNSEKTWRISSAELVNSNGTFDISMNFNVQDDEFVFKNSVLVTDKTTTDFEGSLEWKKNSAIDISADSPVTALIENYMAPLEFSIDFKAESSSTMLSDDSSIEFTIADNGSLAGSIAINDAILNITLTEKLETDYKAIPTQPLVFTPAFTFDSNAISNFAPDMVGSLANNSIYFGARESWLSNPSNGNRPERILKYDISSGTTTEKLFFEVPWDFSSKQLLINKNKLVVVGGHKINFYDFDIAADPLASKTYEDALENPDYIVSRKGSAVNNNNIYIIGGDLGRVLADRIFKYDIETEEMTEFAQMPEPRFGARAEIVDNKLYIFGGVAEFYDPPAKNTIYIYDLSTAALTVEFMPSAVDMTFVGRADNLIYVAGYKEIVDAGSSITTDREPYLGVYDTNNNTYSELQTNLSSPGLETIYAMAVFRDSIYILYGKQEDTDTLQTWTILSAAI